MLIPPFVSMNQDFYFDPDGQRSPSAFKGMTLKISLLEVFILLSKKYTSILSKIKTFRVESYYLSGLINNSRD